MSEPSVRSQTLGLGDVKSWEGQGAHMEGRISSAPLIQVPRWGAAFMYSWIEEGGAIFVLTALSLPYSGQVYQACQPP